MALGLMVTCPFFFAYWDRWSEVVSPGLYRPVHFLSWAGFLSLLYLVVVPRSSWRWPRPGLERKYVGATFIAAGLLWSSELVFGFQARHWPAFVIYNVPLVVTILLAIGRDDKKGRG